MNPLRLILRSKAQEKTMTHDPEPEKSVPANEAREMERVQEDAAEEREDSGGYQ
jgi:hypothetical protein